MRVRHSVIVMLGAAAISGCPRANRSDPAELKLAAAVSDSLTVALADSLGPSLGYSVRLAGEAIESLTACDDRADANGWVSVGSPIVEMQLPPGFQSSGQMSQMARWTGPTGWIRASPHTEGPHSGWTGLITSECDVFVSGYPTHIDLLTTTYGRGVHATIRVQGATPIGIEAMSRTIGGQAQLLHAIRYARVSSAWGQP